MRIRFGEMKMKVIQQLMNAPIMDMDRLRELMMGFCELKCHLQSLSTIEEILVLVTEKCTLLDIRYIELMVDVFNVQELKPELHKYQESLETFCDTITLDLCCNQSFEGKTHGEQLICDTIEFILNWKPQECLLSDVKLILSKGFEKMAKQIKILTVDESHSVRVVCYAHHSIHPLLIVKAQQNLQNLLDNGLKKLTIGFSIIWDGYQRDKVYCE